MSRRQRTNSVQHWELVAAAISGVVEAAEAGVSEVVMSLRHSAVKSPGKTEVTLILYQLIASSGYRHRHSKET
jgi:hypothetical protein